MLNWQSPTSFMVGDTAFRAGWFTSEAGDDEFLIAKSNAMLAQYEKLLTELQPRIIVELGVRGGGSTAFLHAAAQPERLLAFDIDPDVPPGLQAYQDRTPSSGIRMWPGVDQADGQTLERGVGSRVG